MDDEPDEPLETFNGDDVDWGPLVDGDDPPPPRTAPADAGGGRRRTVTGALMAGIAMGLREVFEPEYHDRTAIEQPAPEQPLEPQKYELHLDPVAPESSFAIYRPWVDDDGGPDTDGAATDGADPVTDSAGPDADGADTDGPDTDVPDTDGADPVTDSAGPVPRRPASEIRGRPRSGGAGALGG